MTQNPDLAPLFAPLQIKDVTLRNRFVLPAMQRGWCKDGCPTPQMVEYYRRRAAGGVALLIGESGAIEHPSSTFEASAAHLFGPALEGWARCIDAVKAEGSEMFLQLWFQGATGTPPVAGPPALSPSGLVQRGRANGRAATLEELEAIKQGFVRSALAAKAIGAAGVEVHAAHGYGIDLFLWHETNLRADGYGGPSFSDRLRFPGEIVSAIRAATGPKFIISLRFSQWKEADFDAQIVHSPAELKLLLDHFKTAGVDLFHPSTRRFYQPEWPPSPLGLAGWCKSLTDLPVIAVGSVGLDCDLLNNVFGGAEANSSGATGFRQLRERFDNGEFDLIAVGRSLIGDPNWVNKVAAGQFSHIRAFTRSDLVEGIDWDFSFVAKNN